MQRIFIQLLFSLTLKNVSAQIIVCEDEAVELKWKYELNPKEYVDGKTWSYTKNEKTIPIANWKYKELPILEPNFNNTVTIIGNDSLIIRNITTTDGGTYNLTLFIRQSSQQNPKLALNLTVLKPPLSDCCKPTIQRLEDRTGLRANLDPQACGTGPFELKWNNASGTMSDGDLLIFLASNLTGRFTVCVTGLSIETCFKGKRGSLCQDENIDEVREVPKTTEQNIPLVVGLSIGGTLIVLAVSLVILIIVNWRRIQKYRGRNDNWKTVRVKRFLMEDMMKSVLLSGVFVCSIIAVQIEFALAFAWKNVSRNIASCEHDDVQLTWEYDLIPGEYVKAKTWFTGVNKTAKRIAYWKDTDGLKIEPAYTERVTLAGNGKDSLMLRRVTTRDEGIYTLILSFPLSSEPDPRLALKLSIYEPPLPGCCKPTIQLLENGTGLRANLDPQACGTGPFQLQWNNAFGTMSDGDLLIFLASNLIGRLTVCVTGLSIETCFKGKRESLCQDENIEEMRKFPQTREQDITLVAGLSIGGTIIVLTVILVIIIKINWRRILKYSWRNKKWKTIRATLNFEDDDTLLKSLILTQEVMMDKATKEISNIMYVIFKNSRELPLEEINTTHIELENSEIIYIDNATDSGYGGTIMENRQTNPSYAQSFYHKDKLLKLLVVQGELGIGNTTWCRKLVSTWCKAYENQYLGIPIRTNDENIQTMKSFPLLFFVSLRNAEKGQTLANIIKQQFVMGSVTQNGHFDFNLDMLMNNSSDKIIIIINDVDEADADVDILNEIVSQTKNSLTILTCSDWEPIQSKCRIHEENCRPMAYITLKHT